MNTPNRPASPDRPPGPERYLQAEGTIGMLRDALRAFDVHLGDPSALFVLDEYPPAHPAQRDALAAALTGALVAMVGSIGQVPRMDLAHCETPPGQQPHRCPTGCGCGYRLPEDATAAAYVSGHYHMTRRILDSGGEAPDEDALKVAQCGGYALFLWMLRWTLRLHADDPADPLTMSACAAVDAAELLCARVLSRALGMPHPPGALAETVRVLEVARLKLTEHAAAQTMNLARGDLNAPDDLSGLDDAGPAPRER